jgi:hypothetical protein
MKKISILVAICVMFATDAILAQKHTQHVSFDDGVGPGNAGTYSPTDQFGIDLYLTYAGYDSVGFSLSLETTADAAPSIFVTGFTYGTTFDDPNFLPPPSFPDGFTLLQSNGLYTTPSLRDLGATSDPHAGGVAPGTYFVGHLSISLSGLAPGIYILQSTTTSPRASEVTRFDGTMFYDEYLPVSTYTITIVPEPSTFALLIVAALGISAFTCRRAVSKRSYS